MIEGYLMILPWLLGFIVFTAGPMIASLLLSFTQWNVIKPPRFTGLRNLSNMLEDPFVGISLFNTAYFTFIAVPLHVVGALIFALLMSMKLRGIRIYRTLYYLPAVTPAVASALLWAWVFNSDYGLINTLFRLVGLPKIQWLLDPAWAKPAFIIMSLWGLGGAMLIYLAGLQGIPQILYEAAAIDGANRWQRFKNITIPMLTPVIFFNLIMQIIGSFQVFTAAYIITQGGPANATLFYVLYLWRTAFTHLRMGYASALAWVLFMLILLFTVLQLWLSGRWVYYESALSSGKGR
jgi:multiple sugar transport system permease protein